MEGEVDREFWLWHVQELDGDANDEKLIGVYRSEADAKAAIERVRDKPGFAILPDGFQICPYELNRDNWIGGFVITAD